MFRYLAACALLLALAGCGLGETAASAGAAGVSKAEEARQARETEEKVIEALEEAQRQASEQRAAADAALE